jgi:ANTAR domain
MGREATPDVAGLRRLAGRVAAEMDRRDVLDLDARIAQLERRVDGLIDALRCRDVIGQAKGVLMSHDAIDADAAFERLRELSRAAGVEVVELASAFVGQVRARGPVCAGDRRTIDEILDQLTATVPTRPATGTDPG